MLTMARYHHNTSTNEQTFLGHSDNDTYTYTNDARRPFHPPHINSASSRLDQAFHVLGQFPSPSRTLTSNSVALGFDYLTQDNTHSQHQPSSDPHPHRSLPLEILPPAGTSNTPSLPLPRSVAPSDLPQNFPFYPSPATLARDDLRWPANSPPSTSDVTPDPASLPELYPSEQNVQSRQSSLIPSGQQQKHLPPPYPQEVNSSNSASLLQKDQEEIPYVKIGPNGLAEDQPPTAQGKMRTRVYVACMQCRFRKIRCDGAKPKCQKCVRRANDCDYDPIPKRRGPDKKPGARQRTSKKAKATKDQDAIKEVDAKAGTAAKGKMAGEINFSLSSSLNSSRTSPGRDPDSSSHTLLPLQNLQPYDLEAHRGSISSSVEYPLPITSVDDPEITLYLTSASAGAEAPNPSFHPEKVNESRRFFRLSPESVSLSNGLSLGLSLAPSYDSTPKVESRNNLSSRIDLEVPYHGHGEVASFLDDPTTTEYQGEDEIGPEPSLDYSRKTWWDSLVALYTPTHDRATSSRQILADLRFLFKTSNYFFSFINVPLFFSIFCNPVERDRMQPSLVLSILAVSAFITSSEIDQGNAGRMRAMWLRDAAQSSLEASLNAQWIDPTLAQAAWLLALFEMCLHPLQCTERVNSAMVILDSVIRSLRLTSIDEHDPRASKFDSRNVPIVHVPVSSRVTSIQGCCCASLTLGHNSPASHQQTPLWAASAAWNPDWTVAEIRKEESRRLCWSSLQIAAGHTAHAAAFSSPPLDYYCIQPSNYSLLFPGESLLQSPSFSTSHSPKESIWALYSRAMLLWNSCLRMRESHVSDAEKANFAVNAWIETIAIEDALNAHTCGCDQAFLFQAREFLFITRMCISYEFRRFIPLPESDFDGLFNRRKAEDWIRKQATIAKRIMQGLHTVTGHKNNVLAQRPFFIWWFMGQFARCLLLWQLDNSLITALEVCEAFFAPIDYLSCLWPCPSQRARYLELHSRLRQACLTAGLPPPSPPNFNLFAPGSPPVPVV